MAWNRTNEKKVEKKGGQRNVRLKGLLAGAIVVLGAGLAAWLLTNGETASSPLQKDKTSLIKEVTPTAAPKYKEEPRSEEPKEDPERAKRKAMLAKMTPEERINFRFQEELRKSCNLKESTNKAYRNGVEQIMSWMFTRELGDPPALLPQIPIRDEAHLVSILISPNMIGDGDSEKVKEAKIAVNAAKKELIKYIKEGGDVHSFLEYYHNQLVQAHQEHTTASVEVNRLVKSDPDIAPQYFNKVNEMLATKGIKPVKPNKALQRLADEQGVELKY